MRPSWIAQIDSLIRQDPARRGLIGGESQFGPLCPGHLAEAAAHLAAHGRHVAIVTGFFIPGGDPPAAETDGPPGALLLAEALRRAGMRTCVVTDGNCLGAIAAAAEGVGFPVEGLVRFPFPCEGEAGERGRGEEWCRAFLAEREDLTHLIAIERVGPSHSRESFLGQKRTGEPPVELFEARLPRAHRDHCHNIRGEVIDEFTGDLHRLFEEASQTLPSVTTIGIGDGGNEIGMGAIPWEDLERRLAGDQSGWLPCRIPCDWNIVAGTSNWGGYALAAATLHLRGQSELLRPFTAQQQRRNLETLVANGPAVDGVTRRREPTVDGIPFPTYIQPWEEMRRLIGQDS